MNNFAQYVKQLCIFAVIILCSNTIFCMRILQQDKPGSSKKDYTVCTYQSTIVQAPGCKRCDRETKHLSRQYVVKSGQKGNPINGTPVRVVISKYQ